MNLDDLTVMSGFLLTSFALGYTGSWLMYVFRRTVWTAFR